MRPESEASKKRNLLGRDWICEAARFAMKPQTLLCADHIFYVDWQPRLDTSRFAAWERWCSIRHTLMRTVVGRQWDDIFLRLLLQRAEFEGRNAHCELLVGQCWKDDRNVNWEELVLSVNCLKEKHSPSSLCLFTLDEYLIELLMYWIFYSHYSGSLAILLEFICYSWSTDHISWKIKILKTNENE